MLWNTGHCAQGAKIAQDRCCGILDTVLRGQRLRRTDVVEYWTLCSGGNGRHERRTYQLGWSTQILTRQCFLLIHSSPGCWFLKTSSRVDRSLEGSAGPNGIRLLRQRHQRRQKEQWTMPVLTSRFGGSSESPFCVTETFFRNHPINLAG